LPISSIGKKSFPSVRARVTRLLSEDHGQHPFLPWLRSEKNKTKKITTSQPFD
jgi:hypothetical protein